MKTKICSHCKIEKTITDFYKDNSKKDGYSYNCKRCQNSNRSRNSKAKHITNKVECLENEIWKEVEGYEGIYQVSSLGRIKRKLESGEMLIKISDAAHGYKRVSLKQDGKLKTCSVHRLVAQAFIPNPNNLQEVNHKDEDKTNNKISNLEWCDRKYNMNYGTGKQRMGLKMRKKVYQYDLNKKLIKVWDSVKDCGNNGYNPILISNVCNNKRKTHKKSIWSYEEL